MFSMHRKRANMCLWTSGQLGVVSYLISIDTDDIIAK